MCFLIGIQTYKGQTLLKKQINEQNTFYFLKSFSPILHKHILKFFHIKSLHKKGKAASLSMPISVKS